MKDTIVRAMNENCHRCEENFKTIVKELDSLNDEIEKLKGRCRIFGVII